MKALMKNIKPQTCANIMNLIQSILVIKNKKEAKAIQKLIDEQGFVEIYGYCSKNGRNLVYGDNYYYSGSFKSHYFITSLKDKAVKIYDLLNDKVVFKFHCFKIEEIKRKYIYNDLHCVVSKEWLETNTCNQEELSKKTCLTKDELFKCLGVNFTAYAIYIRNLKIFDEPKEVCEFYKANEQMEYIQSLWNDGGLPDKDDYDEVILTKAPKNFCYVEIE